ncbi:MAG: DotH/IcmK family type IV secretion protein [Acetobacter syzygii]|uniref:DotH/IcmK family type IV secretion protein n=1 Tax=Acetobacter syzygii TaxID=146476 RepID=UPI0039E88C40
MRWDIGFAGLMVFLYLNSCQAAFAQRGPDNERDQLDPIYASLPPPPQAMSHLYDRFDAGQRALDGVDDPHRLVSPVSRTVSVSFTSGGQINIIRIAQDYPSSISFVDSTGQPWPIAWDITTKKSGGCDDKGDGHNASVRAVGISACVPEPGSNVLQLTPISRYAHGGVLVSLKDAPKPVSFMIIAGTGSYDADMTARVNKRGPNAKDIVSTDPDAPSTGSPLMDNITNGTPPADATPMLVSGVNPDDLRAWKIGKKIYLRTTYQLMSPGFTDHQSLFDTTAYEIPVTTRLLVSSATKQGIPVTLKEDAHE